MAESTLTAPLLSRRSLPFRRSGRFRSLTSVTALDFDGSVLRVAQAALRGNKPAISSAIVAPLKLSEGAEATDPVALGKAAAACLEETGLRPGQVVIGIPRHLVVLRTLTLPAIDDVRELASVVHMQIGKDLPFRQEDAVIDFVVRPQLAGNSDKDADSGGDTAPAPLAPKVDVLVAAVKRETVAFYEQTAAAAGVKLAGLGWLSQANARLLEDCKLGNGSDAVALVSLRPEEVAIDIVGQGALLFSRGCGLPAQVRSGDGRPERGLAEAAAIEVVRSLHSYSGLGGSGAVSKIVVIGATGQEQLLVALLGSRGNLPAQALSPADVLNLPEQAREHAAGAFSAIGLATAAVDPAGLPFDFLDPKRPAVQRDMRRIWTLAGVALGLAALIGLFAFRSHLINNREKVRAAAQAELKKAEANLPLFRRMQQQAATLQNWSKDSRNWLEHYSYLSAVLPGSEDLYITSLSVGGQGNIHLAVQARSGETLANLDRQLRAAGYEVKPLAITPGNEKHGYNFRSTVELIVPAKMKMDLTKAQPPVRPADDGSLDVKPRKGGRS